MLIKRCCKKEADLSNKGILSMDFTPNVSPVEFI